MSGNWRRDKLPELVTQLAQRPGHEPVRIAVSRLIVEGLGRQVGALTQEYRMPLVGGRADALFGATVFEFKSDLRHELRDVEAKLPDYLAEHERQTGRKPALGISTDGATWLAHELRDGVLTRIGEHKLDPSRADALLAWLEPAVSEREDLTPEPRVIAAELGRESLTFRRAFNTLETLWKAMASDPEAKLKRELWDRLLREVYGEDVGEDRLFLQHSYLTIVAKTIAARVFDLPADEPLRILSGAALEDLGIQGAVEGDFFDWVLHHPDGPELVRRLALQVARFRLRDVQQDVLKALYESLMDPEQRKDLGEYYTPDWLAAKLTARAVEHPLTERVLDPACGSGTFLFHAIRRLRAAGMAAGWPAERRLAACVAQVRGLDVHPVAVIIARVTWLLALGDDIDARQGPITVPVFLGDALQWNIATTGAMQEVVVEVPNEPPLRVPAGFAEEQARLEEGVQAIKEGLERDSAPDLVRKRLARLPGVAARDVDAMAATYARILALHRAGQDGIWPFVLRNLVRPLWLSRPDQQADVLLGNPPWVAYRHLSAPMQRRLREASQRMNLWVGGVLSTQQDLCALFTARAAQRYLKPGGRLAFVLPYAALNRPAYKGLRAGDCRDVQLCWEEGWSLDETVQPLFPVPACVLIGRRRTAGPLPGGVTRFSGGLPRRDAAEGEADAALSVGPAPWPPMPTLAGASPYRARFKQGATIVPRRFWFVERVAAGRLGASRATPLVAGKVGKQDKAPWKSVEPPRGPVEAQFLHPVVLGETLAPFRLLPSAAETVAVLPVLADGTVMDAARAEREGFARLADWLANVEGKWATNANKGSDGKAKMTLTQNLDHLRKLSQQFPINGLRVAYAKAGTLFAAALLQRSLAIVDHKAYWAPARSLGEARYLLALLNCERIRQTVAAKQSKGQGGARDFDNLMWELPIPEFDARNPDHQALAALAAEAEALAAAVPLQEGAHFTAHRRAIRDALDAAGITQRLDAAVARLPGL
jgi:SAM-dependent methyltransferase